MTELALKREQWRREVPALQHLIPLNHCSQAPPNVRTRAALDRYLDSWESFGMDWDAWITEVEAARASFATLIGADPRDVFVAASVSQAVSSIASALDFVQGRNAVVVDDSEFPTVSHVWAAQARRGAHVRCVQVDGTDYSVPDLGLTEQTAVLSLTHGAYSDGTLRSLRPAVAAGRAVGAVVVVDAYQTLGTLPVDIGDLDVDVLVSGCLKYLLGVPGIAFAYVAPRLSARLEPVTTGWFGRTEPFAFSADLDWAPGARRFDMGTPPILEAHIARAGIDWLNEVGLEQVRASTLVSSDALIAGGLDLGLELAGPRDPRHRTPVVAFRVGDAPSVEAALKAKGVVASARGDVIRLAPHFYTSADDVTQTLGALAEICTT